MSFLHPSLRARMTLAVTGLILVLMLVISGGTLHYFEREFESNLTNQQTVMLNLLTDSIDNTLQVAKTALVNNAKAFPAEALNNPTLAQNWLDSRTGLKTQFFTNHLMLVKPSGSEFAMTPHRPDTSSLSTTEVKAIQHTFKTGKPCISEPLPCCSAPNDLQIIFTAPVEQGGKVTMVMTGSFSLLKPNLLSRHMSARIGSSGFVRLINREHRGHLHHRLTRAFAHG